MSIDVETMKLKRPVRKSSLVPEDEMSLGLAPMQAPPPFPYNMIYGSASADKIAGTAGADPRPQAK